MGKMMHKMVNFCEPYFIRNKGKQGKQWEKRKKIHRNFENEKILFIKANVDENIFLWTLLFQ